MKHLCMTVLLLTDVEANADGRTSCAALLFVFATRYTQVFCYVSPD